MGTAAPFQPISHQPASLAGNHFIQPKLEGGKSGDKYERQADHVADWVMRMPNHHIQQQPVDEELQMNVMQDEEAIQMRPIAVQEEQSHGIDQMCPRCQDHFRQGKPIDCPECREKLLQAKSGSNPKNGPDYAPREINNQLQSSTGGGHRLPRKVQREMSTKMVADFSDVKVHTDSKSAEMTDSLGAKAFTYGSDIYFNQHQYSPGTATGKHLLAHELTYVIQQSPGNSKQIQRKAHPKPKCNNIEYNPKYYCCINGQLTRQNPITSLEDCPDRAKNTNRMNEYDGCSVPKWLSIGQDKDNPADGTDTHFSDTSIHGTKPQSFIPKLPCDIHDKCYQTCWPSHMWEQKWEECDQELIKNAAKVCNASSEPIDVKFRCLKAVVKAENLLPWGSWGSFKQRQQEYCNCCPPASKPVKGNPELLVNADNVWFVSDPLHWSDKRSLISKLAKGTKVKLLEKGSGESFNNTDEIYQWWKVELNNQVGWIMQVYLDEVSNAP
ncbi:DUF4157 domain-containing protein [Aliifodinibius sp. S!AR15-10]|uniref:eCIS core domain-containing protein n=1 Tax=Aliifodinibius sp. S!AR15-10 TaxID=2950437 RepID=UPI00285BAC4E|nr:DUF4157 domain-containing protein [Aliifodinibius sp. S!AR15-10]MDR8390606.1 DUF4157 domain-containing protein [Aliifodinibius sp. S!AR15-10]